MAWQASTRAKSPGSWTTRSTSSAYADRTSRSSGSHSTPSISCGGDRGRARSPECTAGPRGGTPPYSSPEADGFGQGPVEPDQTLRGSVQHLEKTHKLRSESKRLQSAQEIPMVHSIKRLLLIKRQEDERQTVSTPKFQKISD
ncbi:unnamed protein product [Caretta caretta]